MVKAVIFRLTALRYSKSARVDDLHINQRKWLKDKLRSHLSLRQRDGDERDEVIKSKQICKAY